MSDLTHIREIDRVLSGQAAGTQRDPLVLDSWRRCVETYGLDPAKAESAHIVTDTELRLHREQAERLIATARSGLKALFRQVAEQNYVLLLADAKGICVDSFGDPRFEEELRRSGLYLGSDWSEDLAGTCGVGSCLVTGEAVTIHQSDHFGIAHTPLSCTAAPIYDTHGKLSAVLDVSLLRSPSPKSSQNLAMNLVKASARRVEMANLMAMTRRDWVLRFSTSPEFLEVDPEAAVALDGSGRIIGMTHGAGELLMPGAGAGLIGTRVDAVLDMSVDDLPDLMRGRAAEERVLRLKDGRGLYGHAIAPQQARVAPHRRDVDLPAPVASLAGADPTLNQLQRRVARLAPTQVPLMLQGETGTGKERFARAIHVSAGQTRALHVVRCATLQCNTLAALETAGPGTLLLKGVDEVTGPVQSGLLELIEKRPDLRVISTCQRDLRDDEGSASFRADLFYRLAGDVMILPPLRLRHDIDWLIDRVLRRHAAKGLSLSAAARAELASRPWPGNIRELESVIDVAAAVADGTVIDLPDLPAAHIAQACDTQTDAALEALLDACGWNMSRAARRMGVNRSTVLRRIRKAGLSPPVSGA